ncbi:glycine oxidase ThiO [Larsenimonas rhizosphaerae]|uniref:glycine oxidase ThiO n=1 Tax=Larsenimonas rhizosphaerae TaxID=2944682 RepID=UPI002033AE15|nr:glycine oxidase ThiO [Larsenimonas rhizosphaerae]MCM2132219.1 glycine oxidase ThiO [Larsenimonas rhizosphaerae]
MSDVLIIGGGVSGLMTAWHLVQTGASVSLIDRRQCAQESSWAGGGIISPLYPWTYSDPVTVLSDQAIADYRPLVDTLRADTGIDPEYHTPGIFHVNVDDPGHAHAWARRHGKELEQLDQADFRARVPLVREARTPLYMPGLGSLRTPRLGKALRQWAMSSPYVRLLEEVTVRRIRIDNDRATGVETDNAVLDARQVVVCSGAWSGELLADIGVQLSVYPVKGEMLLFKAAPGRLQHVVLSEGFYAIPRQDGHILFGSTFEHAGYDKTPTASTRSMLYRQALHLMPGLADCPVVHHWAGLRPGSPNSIPFIGAVPEVRHLWVNSGHFGNGVVLAPGASRLLVEQMTGQTCCVDPAPYQVRSVAAAH